MGRSQTRNWVVILGRGGTRQQTKLRGSVNRWSGSLKSIGLVERSTQSTFGLSLCAYPLVGEGRVQTIEDRAQ